MFCCFLIPDPRKACYVFALTDDALAPHSPTPSPALAAFCVPPDGGGENAHMSTLPQRAEVRSLFGIQFVLPPPPTVIVTAADDLANTEKKANNDGRSVSQQQMRNTTSSLLQRNEGDTGTGDLQPRPQQELEVHPQGPGQSHQRQQPEQQIRSNREALHRARETEQKLRRRVEVLERRLDERGVELRAAESQVSEARDFAARYILMILSSGTHMRIRSHGAVRKVT